MASDKQILANRQNSKLGGPKTKDGKNKVRLNAKKHGILSLLKTSYEEDILKDLLSTLYVELHPVGIIEELLVEKIATCYLRTFRLSKAEADFIETSTADDGTYRIFAPEPTLKPGAVEKLTSIYSRYETSLDNRLFRLLRELDRLQQKRTMLVNEKWDCLAK